MTKKLFEQEHVKKVSSRLANVLRTGWVRRGVSKPENVLEHTEELISLAETWAHDLDITDLHDLQHLLAFHDWPEMIVGDIVVAHLDDASYVLISQDKKAREREAAYAICEPLGEDGGRILEYWHRFERQEDANSKIAHEIDKMQAVLKALAYERNGEPVMTQEFIDEIRRRGQVRHPFLVAMLTEIESSLLRT